MNPLNNGNANNQMVIQNPRESALNLMRRQRINIPKGMENNPQALLQQVMQSGAVPQNRLSMAQQMMSKMLSGR